MFNMSSEGKLDAMTQNKKKVVKKRVLGIRRNSILNDKEKLHSKSVNRQLQKSFKLSKQLYSNMNNYYRTNTSFPVKGKEELSVSASCNTSTRYTSVHQQLNNSALTCTRGQQLVSKM
jgi:hypothetical protein